MKKILLLFILISGIAFGQKKKINAAPKKLTAIEMAQKKGKEYFEENIVKNFKDPYSYELKKIWTEEVTVLMYNVSLIENYEKYNFKKDQDSLMMATSAMSDEEKHKINSYIVYIDAYGANSYGNKILGRYKFRVSSDGSDVWQIKE